MRSLIEYIQENQDASVNSTNVHFNESLLGKVKSLFKKSKDDIYQKEQTIQQMLDKIEIHELDDISENDLIKIANMYKKTLGSKYDFNQPIDCLSWIQGLYDGAYTNSDDTEYDLFGEKRLDSHIQKLANDPDAENLVNSDGSELIPSARIDYIHGYVYSFEFTKQTHLKCKEKKYFTYKDGIALNKKLK